jgi:hypothetical protein
MIVKEPVTLTTQDNATVEAMLHVDDQVPKTTAVLILHPTSDWRNHFILSRMAERGFGGMGLATRFTTCETELILEETLLDMAAAVDYLRASGYRRVLGIGSSGGAELIAGYQSEAIRSAITGTPLGDPPDLTKAKLSPLDALIFINPHLGRPFSMTRSLDPSVGGENGNDPLQYDPSLDMYHPDNKPPFSEQFRRRYEAAQIERNNKITRWCMNTVKEIERVGNPGLKDFVFLVHRTSAVLHIYDRSLSPTDRSGKTIWDEDPFEANYTAGPLRGNKTRLRVFTLRSWISQRGLMTSHFDVLKHAKNCEAPSIVICGTAEEGGPDHSLMIYEALPDPKKKLAWIKDARHFMAGQDRQQADAADLIAQWLVERALV